MVIITNYRQEKKDGKIYIHPEEPTVCPVCCAKLTVIGSRNRKVIGTDGKSQTLVIRRLRCKNCGQVHHELPNLLVPYKRHCTETIEQVVSEKVPTGISENTTIQKIKNWWQGMSMYISNIVLSLEIKNEFCFSEPIKLTTIVRAVVNSHSWVHTRSAGLSS